MAKPAETASVNFIDAPPLTAAMRMLSMTHLIHPCTAQMPWTELLHKRFLWSKWAASVRTRLRGSRLTGNNTSELNTRELQDAIGQSKIKSKTEAQIFKQQYWLAEKHKVSIAFKVGNRIKLIKLWGNTKLREIGRKKMHCRRRVYSSVSCKSLVPKTACQNKAQWMKVLLARASWMFTAEPSREGNFWHQD